MTDKLTLKSMIDELGRDDLEELYQYIRQRRQVGMLHEIARVDQTLLEHPEPADTIREEVNSIIDEAINSVRRVHKAEEIEKISEPASVR